MTDKSHLSLKPLMAAQIAVEVEAQKSHYQKRIDLLRKTLMGFASNGTACKACQMSNELASHALKRDDNGGVCEVEGCWCMGNVVD